MISEIDTGVIFKCWSIFYGDTKIPTMNQTNNNIIIKLTKVVHLISFQSYDFKEQHELCAAKAAQKKTLGFYDTRNGDKHI